MNFAYNFDRLNFWAYVDEKDSAQSIEKGLTADYEGSHALFINAATNWLDYDSQTLAHLFFPEIGQDKVALHGADALVSIAKARALIHLKTERLIQATRETGFAQLIFSRWRAELIRNPIRLTATKNTKLAIYIPHET